MDKLIAIGQDKLVNAAMGASVVSFALELVALIGPNDPKTFPLGVTEMPAMKRVGNLGLNSYISETDGKWEDKESLYADAKGTSKIEEALHDGCGPAGTATMVCIILSLLAVAAGAGCVFKAKTDGKFFLPALATSGLRVFLGLFAVIFFSTSCTNAFATAYKDQTTAETEASPGVGLIVLIVDMFFVIGFAIATFGASKAAGGSGGEMTRV